jgi:tetratricopeptide (TPR) repeat protein
LTNIRSVRPSREERADRLGLTGDDRASYLSLAAGYDDARDGEILLRQGKTVAALVKLVPVADSGQRFASRLVADVAQRKAQELQRHNQVDAALEQFLLERRYDPDRLEALVGVGYIDLFIGKLDEADTLLTRAVQLYPRSAGAVYRLGALRQAQGRNDEAERLYRDAIARAPLLAPPRGLLGSILLARGDAKGALDLFDSAVKLGDTTEGVVAGQAEARRRLAKP